MLDTEPTESSINQACPGHDEESRKGSVGTLVNLDFPTTLNAVYESDESNSNGINCRGYGEKDSILDTLLDQMEELMTNLQHIVEQRGTILQNDKVRSEELLFRLLPK